jgi:ComF family protein
VFTTLSGPSGSLRALPGAIADLLWPRRCASCDEVLPPSSQPAGPFCAPCDATLLSVDPAVSCPRCAAPLVPSGSRCEDCARARPVFQRLTTGYLYGGALVPALLRLKWQGRDDLAGPLSRLLCPPLRQAAARCDLLVPMPLHLRRLRERGYNQAGLLCRGARRLSGVRLPIADGVLVRHQQASPSRHQGPAARFLRVAGAFRVPPGQAARLGGRAVLLIDDVATTLATAQAAALSLLSGGAASVEVLTLCRAAP